MEEEMDFCEVDLIGHCAFCRRKFVGRDDGLSSRKIEGGKRRGRRTDGVVPEAVTLPPSLESFSHLWSYLVKDGGTVGKFRFWRLSKLQEIPPMCQWCGDKIEELDKLHQKLMLKVEEIKRIVAESTLGGAYSWRNEDLGKELEHSALEPFLKMSTLQFLNKLQELSLPMPLECDTSLYGQGDNADDNADSEKFFINWNTEVGVQETLVSKSTSEMDPLDIGGEMEGEEAIDEIKEEADSPAPSPGDDDEDGDPAVMDFLSEASSNSSEVGSIEDEEWTEMGMESKMRLRQRKSIENEGKPEFSNLEQEEIIDLGEHGEEGSDLDFPMDEPLTEKSSDDNEAAPSSSSSLARKKVVKRKPVKQKKIGGKTKMRKRPQKKTKKDSSSQQCDLCEEQVSFQDIAQHLATHNVQEYMIKCPNSQCPFTFSNKFSLERLHLFQSNRGSKTKAAKKCREALELLDQNTKWFRNCEACQQEFKDVGAFRMHSRMHERESAPSANSPTKPFRCPIQDCERTFSLGQNMEVHISRHTLTPASYQACPLCRVRKLSVGKEMLQHLNKVHDVETEKTILCKQCPFIFPSRQSLFEHQSQHRHEGILCDLCDGGEKYFINSKLRQHYLAVHKIQQFVFCDKPFLTEKSLRSHKQASHARGPLPCDQCEVAYSSEKGLTCHKIRVHGADPEPLKCKQCERVLSSFGQLAAHEKTHLATKDFKCDREACDKSYATINALMKHIRATHLRKNAAVCPTCGKTFYNSGSLRKHTDSIHLGIKHECKVCGALLADRYSLSQHLLTHQEPSHLCPECGKAFKSIVDLRIHTRRHDKNRSMDGVIVKRPKGYKVAGFKCKLPNCGQDFTTWKQLFEHKKAIHGEWKKFVCEICGRAYATIYGLRDHNKVAHLGVKIICDVCGQTFGSKVGLALHKLVHKGERPHECHICKQKFRQMPHLKHHLKLHEKLEFQPRGSKEIKKKMRT